MARPYVGKVDGIMLACLPACLPACLLACFLDWLIDWLINWLAGTPLYAVSADRRYGALALAMSPIVAGKQLPMPMQHDSLLRGEERVM